MYCIEIKHESARLSSTYTKIGMIQRRLAWPRTRMTCTKLSMRNYKNIREFIRKTVTGPPLARHPHESDVIFKPCVATPDVPP